MSHAAGEPKAGVESRSARPLRGKIISAGSALARRVVKNDDLGGEFGVTSAWIEQRCGIPQRFVAECETATSLGLEATLQAMEHCSERPDLLLCATYSPDHLLSPIAPAIAHQAGLGQIAAFDLNAACSGGVTAFLSALAFINAGLFRNVLVVATDTTTKHLRKSDLKTRMLFSDGAVALFVGPPDQSAPCVRVRSHRFGSDGERARLFAAQWTDWDGARPQVEMDGPAMFRFAVEAGARLLNQVCEDAGISAESLDRVLIHQANARITQAIQKQFGTRKELWPSSLGVGNLAGASVLFLLAQELAHSHSPMSGSVALISFGAGLTWAGTILEVSW